MRDDSMKIATNSWLIAVGRLSRASILQVVALDGQGNAPAPACRPNIVSTASLGVPDRG